MIKFIALSDIHGDITHFGTPGNANEIIHEVKKINPNIFAVPGNCDNLDIDRVLNKEGVGLHRKHVTIKGVAFAGLGGSLPCPGATPLEFSDEKMAAFLDESILGLDQGTPLILISHQPPYGTVADKLSSGMHVGSFSVSSFIEKHKPIACFCGHIHESRGLEKREHTWITNPGRLKDGWYAYAEYERKNINIELKQI